MGLDEMVGDLDLDTQLLIKYIHKSELGDETYWKTTADKINECFSDMESEEAKDLSINLIKFVSNNYPEDLNFFIKKFWENHEKIDEIHDGMKQITRLPFEILLDNIIRYSPKKFCYVLDNAYTWFSSIENDGAKGAAYSIVGRVAETRPDKINFVCNQITQSCDTLDNIYNIIEHDFTAKASNDIFCNVAYKVTEKLSKIIKDFGEKCTVVDKWFDEVDSDQAKMGIGALLRKIACKDPENFKEKIDEIDKNKTYLLISELNKKSDYHATNPYLNTVIDRIVSADPSEIEKITKDSGKMSEFENEGTGSDCFESRGYFCRDMFNPGDIRSRIRKVVKKNSYF